jgi:glucose dehydrogenase
MESIRFNPRQTLLAALVAATFCAPAAAAGAKVSWEDILNDDKTTGDVLSYGLGLKAQRHSTLTTVNTKNVENLVPAWSFSFGGEKQRGQEGQVLVHDGVIYATSLLFPHFCDRSENRQAPLGVCRSPAGRYPSLLRRG